MGRRNALRLFGAAIAASCAPASNRRTETPRAATPRIAIVGAGIAGLNAALTLTDACVTCTVYEASKGVGGRMRSDATTFGATHVVEHCGEFIDTVHSTMQSLTRRFGLSLVDVEDAEPDGAGETYHFLGSYYSPADADRDFVQVRATLQAQDRAAPRGMHPPTADIERLDRMSVYEWIDTYIPGGHKSKFGALLDVAYRNEFGRDTPEQSSLNLVNLLASCPTSSLNLYGMSDERYQVVGGNQRLPQALAASLPRGSIQTEHLLAAVAKRADGAVELTFRNAGGHEGHRRRSRDPRDPIQYPANAGLQPSAVRSAQDSRDYSARIRDHRQVASAILAALLGALRPMGYELRVVVLRRWLSMHVGCDSGATRADRRFGGACRRE